MVAGLVNASADRPSPEFAWLNVIVVALVNPVRSIVSSLPLPAMQPPTALALLTASTASSSVRLVAELPALALLPTMFAALATPDDASATAAASGARRK